eukprot:3472997-Rhodomonas_salina.2
MQRNGHADIEVLEALLDSLHLVFLLGPGVAVEKQFLASQVDLFSVRGARALLAVRGAANGVHFFCGKGEKRANWKE